MRRGRDPIRREGTRAPNHRGWEYRVWPDATMTTWDTGEFPWMALFRRGPRWRWEARMTRSIHVDPRRGRAPTKRKAVDKARASIDIAIAEREANKARGASALDGVHPMTDIFIKFRGDDVIDVPGFEEELFELAEGDGGEVGGTSAVRLLSRGVSVSELLRQGAEESVQKASGIARKAMREGSGVPIKSSPGPAGSRSRGPAERQSARATRHRPGAMSPSRSWRLAAVAVAGSTSDAVKQTHTSTSFADSSEYLPCFFMGEACNVPPL